MVNVKAGAGLLLLAAISYVAFSASRGMSRGNHSSFDASIFTRSAKSEATKARINVFNSRIQAQINQINQEIGKASAFISKQKPVSMQPRGCGKLGCYAPITQSQSRVLAGDQPFSTLNSAAQSSVISAAQTSQNRVRALESIDVANDFIKEQQKTVSLLKSQLL